LPCFTCPNRQILPTTKSNPNVWKEVGISFHKKMEKEVGITMDRVIIVQDTPSRAPPVITAK